MIRVEAGMPTARFVRLIGVPERSYRRWQQRQRDGKPVKGPWPDVTGGRARACRYLVCGQVSAVGQPHDRDADADRRSSRARLDRVPGAEAHRQGAGGRLPGRTSPARPGAAGGVRGAALGPESRSGSSTSPSSRPATAAPGGSARSPTTGRSSSSATTSRRPRTTATRSRPSSRRLQRPSGCSVGRYSTS